MVHPRGHRPGRAMRSRLSTAVLVSAVVPLIACDEDPTAEGAWFGAVQGYYSSMSLVLHEAEGEVTGSGYIGSTVANLRLTVRGTHVHPAISLTLSAEGYVDAQFNGAFESEDVIAGELTESAFFGDAVRLERNRSR